MGIGRKISVSILIIGILFLVGGIVSLFFLQTTLGEVSIGSSHLSNTFYLEEGKSYSLVIAGLNRAWGYGSGTLKIYYSDGIYLLAIIDISYSFPGDTDYSSMVYGTVTASDSGNYYLEYTEVQNYVSSGYVKISLQESLVQSLTGINELVFIVLGFIMTFVGIFAIPISGFFSSRRPPAPSRPFDYDMVVDIEGRRPMSTDRDFDVLESPDFKRISPRLSRCLECPLCGYKAEPDENYCSECGTQLRT